MLEDLGEIPGGRDFSLAESINDAGIAVGYSRDVSGRTAVIWENDQLIDLGNLVGGSESAANDINENNQIIGFRDAGGARHGFYWDNGKFVDLGFLIGGANRSNARGINDHGEVVGSSGHPSNGSLRATYWREEFGLLDLNTLIDPADLLANDVEIFTAKAINNLGQIAAQAWFPDGSRHGLLLTPRADTIPTPPTLSLLSLGIALVAFLRQRKPSNNV